jgi:hypothetical protein
MYYLGLLGKLSSATNVQHVFIYTPYRDMFNNYTLQEVQVMEVLIM